MKYGIQEVASDVLCFVQAEVLDGGMRDLKAAGERVSCVRPAVSGS